MQLEEVQLEEVLLRGLLVVEAERGVAQTRVTEITGRVRAE